MCRRRLRPGLPVQRAWIQRVAVARGTDRCATGRICTPVSHLCFLHSFVTDCGLRVLGAMTKLLAQLVCSWFWAFVYDGKVATAKSQLWIRVVRARLFGILVTFDLMLCQSTTSFTRGSQRSHKTVWDGDVKGQSGCQTL